MSNAAAMGLTPGAARGMHELVEASRRRSLRLIGSPEHARPLLDDAERDLAALRDRHPLAPVYDVLHHLLVVPARESGLIVAVTDALGRLVWVEGDAAALRRAERMAFVPGANWSEDAVGTSAPGIVLATGTDVQVVGAEHFAPAVHPWNCSAVLVRHPVTGQPIGAVDITGDERAVAAHALPLLRAAVTAAGAQLQLHAMAAAKHRQPIGTIPDARGRFAEARPALAAPAMTSITPPPDAPPPAVTPTVTPSTGTPLELRLECLGRRRAALSLQRAGRTVSTVELSRRHSDMLLLLATHEAGLSGGELAALLYEDGGRPVTLRAEVARLRAVLAELDPSIRLRSQPYRLDGATVRVDAVDVLEDLDRGAHRRALRAYAGPPLPDSAAPGVQAFRAHTHDTLHHAIRASGNLEAVLHLLASPDSADDVELHLLALQLLPARSPKRSAILARLEDLEA